MKAPMTRPHDLVLACLLVAGPAVSATSAGDPVFFSNFRETLGTCGDTFVIPPAAGPGDNTYSMRPIPSWWGGPLVEFDSGIIDCTWEEMENTGRPVAIFMSPSNTPWPGATTSYPTDYPYFAHGSADDPLTLAKTIHNRYFDGSSLDFVYADFEPHQVANGWDDIRDIMEEYIGIVHGTRDIGDPFGLGNGKVPASAIAAWDVVAGNYNVGPRAHGTVINNDPTMSQYLDVHTGYYSPTGVTWWNATLNHAPPHSIFCDLNLKLSMPVVFARGEAVVHLTGRDHWSDPATRCPTPRAAMMWSSIERFSVGAREHCGNDGSSPVGPPPEHVVPWIAPYFINGNPDSPTSDYYEGWFPPAEDFLAAVKHFKLRGADGYVFFRGSENNGGWYDRADNAIVRYYESAPWFDASAAWYTAANRGDWFEEHALLSWDEIDISDDAVPYRLETSKSDGYFVSAANDLGNLVVLISNVGDNPSGKASVDVGALFPGADRYNVISSSTSLVVGDGTHVVNSDFFTPDIDGDHDVDCDDLSTYT
ncbi:MAG: hypothetical protein AAGA55_05505, partial [Planctomycetota bacterium]